MKKSNISGAKQRQIKAVVSEIVGTKLATLSEAAGDRLIARLDAFEKSLAPTIRAAIDQFSADLPSVLKMIGVNVQLDAIASYDPKEFSCRRGLWISPEFRARIGSKAKPVNNLPAMTLVSGDLIKDASDREIKADPVMPANNVFESESAFVAHLDQMIRKQRNGEEGDLITDGSWNIFYVGSCVVHLRWNDDHREWDVYACGFDDVVWGAGFRAFGCN